MAEPLALTGKRFNWWTVIERVERPVSSKAEGTHWLCRCDCGSEQIYPGHRLSSGRGSRGCLACFPREKHGHARSRSLSGTYNSWRGMKERCHNPNHASYPRYGGRGIKVCDRWLQSFNNFVTDLGDKPRGTSLDRINPDKGYGPDNCRWADVKQQATNTVRGTLKDEQRVAILELYKSGASARLIADAVGISRGTVSAIVSYAGYSKRRERDNA